jgi:predicted DCC family thiol-disulfide oxidoreductase YuxK
VTNDTAGRPGHDRLTVLYDADCRLCTRIAGRLAGLDRGRRLRLVALQSASVDRPEVRRLAASRDLAAALHVVDARGRWAAGGEAVVRVCRHVRVLRPIARLARLPLLRHLVDPAYRFVAGHRPWFGWLAGDFGGGRLRRPPG